MQFTIPEISPRLIKFCQDLDCSWLGAVPVVSQPHCKQWDCHNNTLKYTDWYGGERILGYYLLECVDSNTIGAILHSVVKKPNNKLVDITPFDDNRPINMFAILKNQIPNYNVQEIWNNPGSRPSSLKHWDHMDQQ
jgi:hypothetical protein